ncbi:MAG: ABC-F family ATP-binding cassette domain-containing protein, partial [Clostridia bacterium]|nr:ABC-F family ATP-binding cassette domain-containing protein [Clostridia bacterium]
PFEASDERDFAIDIIKQKSGIQDYDYWKIQKEISLLELDEEILYRPFETLSGGERAKILLVSLFLKDGCFLLIDEPTNHMDTKGRRAVAEYLRASKKGFILVSHDRNLLDCSVDHFLSINKTNIEIQKGHFSSWLENKNRQDKFELSKNEKLKKDIVRLEKSAKQSAEWSSKVEKSKNGTRIGGLRPDKGRLGHKSAKMMKRAKNAETKSLDAIKEKTGLLKNIETAESLKISPIKHAASKLIELNNVSIFYGDKKVCEDLNFSVSQGERVAIFGKNGSGKSTILKLICGDKNINFNGNFYKASKLKISYVSQDTSRLKSNLSEFASSGNIDESLFKAILHKFDFSRLQFEKDISDFSEGQKKKVLIASSLCEEAHIYVWDEPLNFIDVLSRMQIEDLILKFKPTMIFVEHDETFMRKIATKVVDV